MAGLFDRFLASSEEVRHERLIVRRSGSWRWWFVSAVLLVAAIALIVRLGPAVVSSWQTVGLVALLLVGMALAQAKARKLEASFLEQNPFNPNV